MNEDPLTQASDPRESVQNLVSVLAVGNQATARIAQAIIDNLSGQSAQATLLSISFSTAGGTLVSTRPGYLVSISVVTPSTTANLTGLAYDSASVANVGSSNSFVQVPAFGFMSVNWPFANGLVIQPSSFSSHKVVVAYKAS